MSISEKIKAINNKIEHNKAQYDLGRQTAKTSALSSGNVSKYEFLSGKDVLPENDFLEKAVTLRTFEYSPLVKELKTQTDNANKQYQGLNKFFGSDEKEEPTLKNYGKSDLTYYANHSFYKYYLDNKNCDNLSLKSKYSILAKFLNDIDKFSDLRPQNKNTKNKKTKVHDTDSELYNKFLDKHFDEYYDLEKEKRNCWALILILLI